LNQLGKALAGYVANGEFYTDSGVANAYILTPEGGKQSPPAYTDGMRVRFVAANNNTGIGATVNVAGLGVKSIVRADGSNPYSGTISGETELVFDLGNDRFELVDSDHILVATSGYQKLPSGLILQWGVSAGVPSGTGIPVTFPLAFPNNVFRIAATARSATYTSSLSAVIGSETVTGFTLGAFSGAGLTRTFDWIAIGY
jgi:hypothetical protein